LSPDLFARIARLEEFVAATRLQGAFAAASGTRLAPAAVTHIAEVSPEIRTTTEIGRTGPEADRPIEARAAEPLRPTIEARGATEPTEPRAPSRTVEIGRATTEAGQSAETGPRTEIGRSATGRPMETGRIAETGRRMETGRAMDNDRTPNGGPRRAAPEYRRPIEDDARMRRPADDRRSDGASSMGWLWALPLAALAGLGWYLLRGVPTDRLGGDGLPTTASREVQPARTATPAVSSSDLQRQALAAITTLTGAVQGITDRGSASTALPKIQDAAKEMDRLAMLSTQLTADDRTALASATRDPITKLNTLMDGAANLPGVGPLLQPTIAGLRGRMDAIAMVPGKPVFFASAPSDWMLLSSFLNRDVQNSAGERVGTATGFFVGPDGRMVASLVSVDRQLGIGDKQVAMPFSGGQIMRKGDGWHLVIDTNKDDLQRAKAFEPGK
jgi:hypothetical protein